MEQSLVEEHRSVMSAPGKVFLYSLLLLIIMIAVTYFQYTFGPQPQAVGGSSGAIITPTGLRIEEEVVGDGPVVEAGDMVFVHYTGWLSDGTKFDSSLDRGQPFLFVLGMGHVIPGWDEGVTGMHVGGVRRLTIPGDLAYGEQGVPGIIPPNETLTFEVELLSLATVEIQELVIGEGPEVVMGDTVGLAYSGFLENGEMFDSTQNHGQLLRFTLGAREMLPGLELAALGMRLGGKRLVTIPPELAFGAQGAGDLIPPGATLIFELELVEHP